MMRPLAIPAALAVLLALLVPGLIASAQRDCPEVCVIEMED